MSTTVTVSRIGRELGFASWATSSTIDADSLREVLGRHGLELLPGPLDRNELIVAQGLSPARAAELAQDLRAIGLTVDVINEVEISESRRVKTALDLSLAAFFFILPFVVLAGLMTQILMAGVLSLLGVFFLLNAMALVWRGGTSLVTVGAVRESPVQGDLARWEQSLRTELPEHVLKPLLEQARELESEARRDPDGPAAAALEALLADADQDRRAETVDKARALRAELSLARRAAAEVGRLK